MIVPMTDACRIEDESCWRPLGQASITEAAVIAHDIISRVRSPRYRHLLLSRYYDGVATDVDDASTQTRQGKNAAMKQAVLAVQDITHPFQGAARRFNRKRGIRSKVNAVNG